jgi:hypothetical protein
MTTEFLVKLAVTLTPKMSKTPPWVLVSVPGQVHRIELWETQRIGLEFTASSGWLEIVFYNKPDTDNTMAVVIDKIEFFGISDPKFVWAGMYAPKYPEPWYSQQTPQPAAELYQQNYLGWNGSWRLDFDIPVFTWMHRIQNLGWIYQ